MSASLVLRPEPARSDDLPAIAALHGANWRSAYRRILPEEALGEPLERGHVIVIREKTAISGFAALVPRGDGIYLDNMHAAPGRRGGGLGTRLMAAVAAAAGPRRLSLGVLEANSHARDVYCAWGGCEGAAFDEEILGAPVSSREVTWPDARALAARLAR